MSKQRVVEKYEVKHPKIVRDWKTDDEKTHWYQLGAARRYEDGTLVVNMNSVPLADWDGTLRLIPIGIDDE